MTSLVAGYHYIGGEYLFHVEVRKDGDSRFLRNGSSYLLMYMYILRCLPRST